MCSGAPAGHPELWVSSLPADRGPEENLRMWREAEGVLDGMCAEAEGAGPDANGAVLTALVDAYNRCIEERRRCEDLLELRRKWAAREIGGVAEPAR